MRKANKCLMSLITLCTAFCSASALKTNAICVVADPHDPQYIESRSKYVEFDDNGMFEHYADTTKYKTYYYNGSTDCRGVYIENYSNYQIDFSIYSDCDVNAVNELILSYDPRYKVYVNDVSDNMKEFIVTDVNFSADTRNNARSIFNELSKQYDVDRFYYMGDVVMPVTYSFLHTVTSYTYDPVKENLPEILRKYLAENNLDFTVIDNVADETNKYLYLRFNACQLVPNYDITYEEHVAVAKKIADDLGYYPPTIRPEDDIISKIGRIDIGNAVNGDANCDGEYTIADSTAILQSLGNPDKYGLSLQGEFNADICNVGDGVTTMDALEVQKAMASKG